MLQIKRIQCYSLIFFLGMSLVLSPVSFAFNSASLEKRVEIWKKNVFAVEISQNSQLEYSIIGSGFFIIKDNYLVGITCKHVVASVPSQNIYIGVNTAKGYQRINTKILYVDQKEDIAILQPIFNSDIKSIDNFAFKSEDLLPIDRIREGKSIISIGYPLNLGIDYDRNYPIVKFGIISQYTGKNYFMIDMQVNPGNSGSPIFSIDDEKIIGIATSYMNDSIILYDNNRRVSASLPYNSGLANVTTAAVLKKILDNIKF